MSEFDCSTWSTRVIDYLRDNFSEDERFKELEPVTKLATEMLSHLLIAGVTSYHILDWGLALIPVARNPGVKKTPQETSYSTPNINRLREIKDLLEDATSPAKRSQSALKELVRYLSFSGNASDSSLYVLPAFQARWISMSLDWSPVQPPWFDM